MKRAQWIETIVLVGLGFATMFEGLRLTITRGIKFYDFVGPGPYLIWIGTFLFILGIVHFISQLKGNLSVTKMVITREMRMKMISVIGALALYTFLISVMGYLLSSIVFFFLMAWIMDIKSWIMRIVISIAFTMSLYLIFVWGLDMMFPRGVLFR